MRHSCLVSALRFICFARELAGDAGDSVLNDGVETEVPILAYAYAFKTLSIRLVLAHFQLSVNKRIIASRAVACVPSTQPKALPAPHRNPGVH